MAGLINQALNGGPNIVPGSAFAWLAYAGANAALGYQTAAVEFFTQIMPRSWDYTLGTDGTTGVATVSQPAIGYTTMARSYWEARALLNCTLQAIYDKGNAT